MKPIMRDIIDLKRNLEEGYILRCFLEGDIEIDIHKDDKITVKNNENYFIICTMDVFNEKQINKIVFLNKIIFIRNLKEEWI